MEQELEPRIKGALGEYLLRLGDDMLVLGHRLSEWCGHGPILEEDVALANMALDDIGQAEALLKLAGLVEGKGRNEDDLAYFREEFEFRNLTMLEQPRGDFSYTMMRQFLFCSFTYLFYNELTKSRHEALAGLAAKGLKEITYHLRHAREWVLRLGDGTDESHDRISRSLEELWRFTDEFFFMDHVDALLIGEGMAPDLEALRAPWLEMVSGVLLEATLQVPGDSAAKAEGSRLGRHSEHLGHMLAQMQILARSHPGARW